MTSPQPQRVPYLVNGVLPDKFISTTFARQTDTVDGTKISGQPIDKGASNSVGFVMYNYSTSSYPVRPTSRTDIMFFWIGPVAPVIGGNYAVNGIDQWTNNSTS